ncbi:MAG: UDP-N-acetylmuramate:L-alanyl-gamma-D-glutamyl-meso-diaminopimelate ligase, partial [Sedimenticola sp.]|nr:UDP-N-acetylmuramate:L-alanyl-gamma-D-glutamyl-meso-diaminopimelate ligase [Sedimenticola sp.]
IFDDLAMIQRQFHHLVRTVPGNGLIVAPEGEVAVDEVLAMGCWTPLERFSPDLPATWSARPLTPDGSRFSLLCDGKPVGDVAWELTGRHSICNALAAIAAARHVGVPPAVSIEALAGFRNVKRRMELRGEVDGVEVYDDFAHHPTAIATTLKGLRAKVGNARILAVLEPRSNTMRMGVQAALLPDALAAADQVLVYSPDSLAWDASAVFARLAGKARIFDSVGAMVARLVAESRAGDRILIMSNGGFENIHQRLLDALDARG